MKRKQNLLSLSLFCVFFFPSVEADAAASTALRAKDSRTLFLKVSDLRSAYLIRAGIVNYDRDTTSAEEIRAQLQRHFDVVLGLLLVSTPHSIDVALDRLEAANGQVWSAVERATWRKQLLSIRYGQLVRLAAYRDRGRFPFNEGQSTQPAPIFVDEHDTACAVGQLMRDSGWKEKVAAISVDNNFVYVPDAELSPIASWVLTSGLTLEEAALIQPAYNFQPTEPPKIPDDVVEPFAASWSGVAGDLRFSNFKLIRDTGGMQTPPVNIAVSHRSCGIMWCTIFPSAQLLIDSGREMTLNAPPSQAVLGFDDFRRVVIQFDVETRSPFQRIAKLPYGSTLLAWPDESVNYQRNEISLFVGENQAELYYNHAANDSDHIAPPNEINYAQFGFTLGFQQFEPTRRMTVVTEVLVNNGRPYEAQSLHFDVITIPEPHTALLLVCGCVALFARRSRRFRRVNHRV